MRVWCHCWVRNNLLLGYTKPPTRFHKASRWARLGPISHSCLTFDHFLHCWLSQQKRQLVVKLVSPCTMYVHSLKYCINFERSQNLQIVKSGETFLPVLSLWRQDFLLRSQGFVESGFPQFLLVCSQHSQHVSRAILAHWRCQSLVVFCFLTFLLFFALRCELV